VTGWQPVAAVHCMGSLLLGPNGEGAEAIIPPAVLARMPFGSVDEYSEDGWRKAIWGRLEEDDSIHTYWQRPLMLKTIAFTDAFALISAEAPDHRGWLRRQATLRAVCLRVLLDHADASVAELQDWRLELDNLLLDAVTVFSSDWLDEGM
jgi:hypothetical protein